MATPVSKALPKPSKTSSKTGDYTPLIRVKWLFKLRKIRKRTKNRGEIGEKRKREERGGGKVRNRRKGGRDVGRGAEKEGER